MFKKLKASMKEAMRLSLHFEYLGGLIGYGGKMIHIRKGYVKNEVELYDKKQYKVVAMDWQENLEHSRNGGKVAVGAIIGSVAGPLGTIAGAAIGGKRKTDDRSIAVITLEDENANVVNLKVRCTQRDMMTFQNMIMI